MHTALPQQLAGSFQDAELSSLVHIWGVLHVLNDYFFNLGSLIEKVGCAEEPEGRTHAFC